jgi:catechol 2,3-dioxygenase-like lactoylglutathione lyase family enzyme
VKESGIGGRRMIRGMFHVALEVSDLEKSINFYKDILEMKLVSLEDVPEEDLKVAFMTSGNCEIEMICRKDRKNMKYASSISSHFPHLAFEVEDVGEVMKELVSKGIKFDHDRPQHCFGGKVEFITFKGPDGEPLEISRRLSAKH